MKVNAINSYKFNNVHFEDVNKGIRIGVIGEPKCTINIDNVSYDVLDPDLKSDLYHDPYGDLNFSYCQFVDAIKEIK